MAGSTTTRKKLPHKAILDKEPSALHESLAEFIASTTGHSVPVGEVALVQRLYPLYLKSPAVQRAKEAERVAREEAARKKQEAKEARLRERLAAIEAQRRELLDALGIDGEQEGQDAPVLPFPKPKAVAEPENEDEDETIIVTLSDDGFEEPDTQDDDGFEDVANDDEEDF